MHHTSHITHSNGYAPYIAYYRSNGFDQLFRKLKPKPKLNPPNAHRSQIKICEKWHTHNVQFRFMPHAFRILKPIQKSSKRVWVFRNTGANAFAKNQMRLAYEDKRDLYCRFPFLALQLFVDLRREMMEVALLQHQYDLIDLALHHIQDTESEEGGEEEEDVQSGWDHGSAGEGSLASTTSFYWSSETRTNDPWSTSCGCPTRCSMSC